jgi:hypothetical protein
MPNRTPKFRQEAAKAKLSQVEMSAVSRRGCIRATNQLSPSAKSSRDSCSSIPAADILHLQWAMIPGKSVNHPQTNYKITY